MRRIVPLIALLAVVGLALRSEDSASRLTADGPADNVADKVRRVPPPGIAIPEADRAELFEGAVALQKEIDALPAALKGKPALAELVPDVQIFANAVRYALKYDEFYAPGEVAVARKFLAQGTQRAKDLRAGKAPWTTETGLVVRGYKSKIDDSVQPYGLVVPASYRVGAPHQHRLDIWFHGRGEKLTELAFLDGRQKNPGEFTPPHAFVLHPYGRYCNANHFAGEVDTFEALEHVQKHYPIDENRIVVRGFSMGGAACWHMAVHHAWRWAAAAPGAGFSETPEFLKVFQDEKLEPTWWEKKLWHMYDCTDWAKNLRHCPTVAYSGEFDSQKQAADIMAKAMDAEFVRVPLLHIIGVGAKHFYTPAAKTEINRRIDSIVGKGRDPMPMHVNLTTWSLRYDRMHWLTVTGLREHWTPGTVDARFTTSQTGIRGVTIFAKDVTALTLTVDSGYWPFEFAKGVRININPSGAKPKGFEKSLSLAGPSAMSDRSWVCHLRLHGEEWKVVDKVDDGALRKRHGLQGPIDDAFMDRFLMVRSTGKPLNDKVGQWVDGEMAHAVEHWRRQFRGEITPKNDKDLTDADIASSNLILWGDPSSNAILAKIADKLPIRWDAKGVHMGQKEFAVGKHVPVLIYPNPLNPKKYVVLNSGFTFREYDYLNNARQVPKLPDWAILDVSQPATSKAPAGIVDAGFFDEEWKLAKAK